MKDRFSAHAESYAVFRPTYPDELYNFIYNHLDRFDTAWDSGTGNGQVARDLARRFTKVYATDISAKQLEKAWPAENIFYSVAGEKTTFQDKSTDLITVAQAIHWFDRDRFYGEVRRVAKENAWLAVWGYSLLSVAPEFDKHLREFYFLVVGPYWDQERKLIDEHYKTISFPFNEVDVPDFNFSFLWTWEELKGYLYTWSSVQKYIQAKGINPVDQFMENMRPLWYTRQQKITFPLFLRLGRIKN